MQNNKINNQAKIKSSKSAVHRSFLKNYPISIPINIGGHPGTEETNISFLFLLITFNKILQILSMQIPGYDLSISIQYIIGRYRGDSQRFHKRR